MSASSLIFEIIGIDRASKTFEKISKGMEKAEDRSKKLKIAGGLALGALAVGAVEFGKKSVEKFQEVGGETIRLQRILGGTATEVSRLRFAAEESGVSADKLGVGFGILSKHLDANDKAWKSLGVNAKDAHGKIRPMSELIPDIAEKFAKMPAGPHKTAEAMKLFGRSGKDLLPFLNKGKTGIEDLGKESDKFGNTLNDKDTAAVRQNIIAKRQLNAAISGLEIQLGRHLVPALAAVVTFLTGTVLWFSHLSTGVKDAVGVAGALIGVVFLIVKATKAWTAVQGALNVVMDLNPIGAIILLVVGLAAAFVYAYKHSETFRNIVQAVFQAVTGAAKATWNWIKGAFSKIKDILTAPFRQAKTDIGNAWGGIKAFFSGAKKVFGALLSGIGRAITKPFTDAFAIIMGGIHAVESAFAAVKAALGGGGPSLGSLPQGPAAAHGLRGRASGGPVHRGTPYIVGENGPELFVPGQSGGIVPNGGSGKSAGMSGDTVIVNVYGAVGDEAALMAYIHKGLTKRKRSIGQGLALG